MKELIGSVALWPAEQLINAAIAADDHVSKKVSRFAGKSIQVSSKSPRAHLRIVFETGSVRMSAIDSEAYGLPVDATIRGTAANLLQQTFTDSAGLPLAGNEVDLSGDVQLVQDLFSAIKSLDVDWQDYLAPVAGDLITQQLGETIEQAADWGQDSKNRLQSSLDTYLKEEIRAFPSNQQLQNFSDDLDQLRLRTDRLAARLKLLNSRLQTMESGPESRSTS